MYIWGWVRVLLLVDDDDDPFIVLTETKFSICYIPVWARYSPLSKGSDVGAGRGIASQQAMGEKEGRHLRGLSERRTFSTGFCE
jgi:hypothetical protein